MALNFDEFPPLPSRTRGVSHGDELRASLLQFQTQNSLRAQRAIAQQGSRNIVCGETETVVVAGNDVDVPVVKMGQDKYRLRDVADVGAATRPVSDLVLWRKEDRAGLDLEHKQVFIKHATGYVLSKGDKLSLPSSLYRTTRRMMMVHWSASITSASNFVRWKPTWCDTISQPPTGL